MKKLSIIFGGTKGIGSVISKSLKIRGDKVITISRCKKKSPDHITADIQSEKGIKKITNKINSKKIHNIIFSQRYRGDIPNQDYEVMVKFTDRMINSLKKKLHKKSSIIVLSSIATLTVSEDQNAEYHYTRHALEGIVKYYAVTLGELGTRVNAIQPTVLFKPENKKFYIKKNLTRKIIEHITPIKKMSSSIDIANLVEFLTSDKSLFITGCIIPVDGGARLRSQEQVIKQFIKI
jgi:NAD(P)-dependent dehydrogenase (short-subunit alcohol dehydrogenase family)